MARPATRFAAWTAGAYALVAIVGFAVCNLAESALGCKIDEGSAHACYVLGVDIGGTLYSIGVLLVLCMLMFPLVVMVVLGALLVGAFGGQGKRT